MKCIIWTSFAQNILLQGMYIYIIIFGLNIKILNHDILINIFLGWFILFCICIWFLCYFKMIYLFIVHAWTFIHSWKNYQHWPHMYFAKAANLLIFESKLLHTVLQQSVFESTFGSKFSIIIALYCCCSV